MFKPLTLSELKRIIDLQLKALRARLADRHIELELDEATKEYIIREAYDPAYGARPLKRFLQRHIETPLARKLISGEIHDNTRILVTWSKGEMAFKAEPLGREAREAA